MVVQTPYSVRAGGFEGVGFYETADELEVGVDDVEDDGSGGISWRRGWLFWFG